MTFFVHFGNDFLTGFILADNGYDVWLGNVRGNLYSRRHVKLNPSDVQFWDWRYLNAFRYTD